MTFPAHVRAFLKERGISVSVATKAGITYHAKQNAIKVTYADADGKLKPYHRLRHLDSDAEDKYTQPFGTKPDIYLSPVPGINWRTILKDPALPLLVTEGEFKSLCATLRGFPTLGIGGVWSWKKDGRPLAALDAIVWEGRLVYILFDSDAKRNGKVCQARDALATELRRRGAEVRIVELPDDGKAKVGLDDFLVAKGANALRALLADPTAAVPTLEDVVAELNQKHALVSVGGRVAVLTETIDPVLERRDFTLSSTQDMRTKYANRPILIGDKRANVFEAWLQSPKRREYESIVFAPGRDVSGHYNLWRGFAVEARKGDCTLFLAHLRDNVCRGDARLFAFVVSWLATMMQTPDQRPGVSIALRGDQGVGKSIVGKTIGALLGQHYVQVTSPRHLTGNFNAHLKDALLVFADEAFWAGDKTAEGALKALVTEDTRLLEFKGKDATPIRNHVWLLIASNHDWVVPAGLRERRFLVLDVGNARIQDSHYFGAMQRQLDSGGREALLYHLLRYDANKVDLRQLPSTPALLETKIRSMSPVQRFVFELLSDGANVTSGEWRDVVLRKEFQLLYTRYADDTGERRRSSETELGMALRKLLPGVRSVRRYSNERTRQERVYLFPPLAECRTTFANALRTKLDWNDPMMASERRREPK